MLYEHKAGFGLPLASGQSVGGRRQFKSNHKEVYMAKLIIFDKDGTLIEGLGGRPANSTSEQRLLPNVRKACDDLRAQDYLLAIASNQGGVAWGFISRSQAYRLVNDAADKIGDADTIACCCYDPRAAERNPGNFYAKASNRRKPQPGMLIDIMRRLNVAPKDTLMVGDRESDQAAAAAAGIKFVWAAEFFGWD
jgi:D-glycero-D-manno-heptose 1,7-bisphosphate phosphatase